MMQRFLIFMPVLILVFLAGCGGESNPTVEPEKVPVETIVAQYGTLVVSKTYAGTISGIEQADLVAKIAETVEKINVREGEEVKADQVLIKLSEGGPGSQYHQAEALYSNAKKLYEKYKNLKEGGAISESQLDQAETNYKVAEANFQAAKQLVYILSPIDGEVAFLNVNVGDQTFMGEPVATVGRMDSVRIEVGVDPGDFGFISVGERVSITMQGVAGDTLKGKVSRVARVADPDTRAFAVEIIAGNKGHILKVGALASVQIDLYKVDNALLVPIDAVLIQKGIPKLFVLHGDTAKSVEVELGRNDQNNYEILSGIKPGDEVVTLGKTFLNDGSLVTLQNKERASQ
jgi:membrane fusion protein (multidrug efflux system)